LKKYAIIVAGGKGTRMGGNLPKQFVLLNDKPLLYYSISTFLKAYDDIQIILVVPPDYMDTGKQVTDKYFNGEKIIIAAGGSTRFQSVKNGLGKVEEESIVFVHDAVRCLLSTALIHRCYEKALETGSAVPVIPSRDSLRLISPEGNETLDRNRVMLVQTPQTFESKILLPAFQVEYNDSFTDEATVVESYGYQLSLVEGEDANIKITTPEDMVIAENILNRRQT